MKELTESFEKSLFTDIIDISQDYIEIPIDDLLKDNDALKEIPIIKSFFVGKKIISNIGERFLLEKIIRFINTLNDGSIDENKKKKYQQKINNNSKVAEKELKRVLFLLDKFIDSEKSIMLAKLFKAYINEIISWNEFSEYSEIVNRIFIQDIAILRRVRTENIDILSAEIENFRLERLQSLGLISVEYKQPTWGDIKDNTLNNIRTISSAGIKFCDCIFE